MVKIAFSPIYVHPLPAEHRFPMLKYELIPEQLLFEGSVQNMNFFIPAPCADEIVLLTHTPAYLQKLKNNGLTASEQRKVGFPLTNLLTERELVITQGTVDCCSHAMAHGVSLNVAGGTHHAFADRGEGFCLLNDQAVAANYLLHQKKANKILIIDLDVHQGNGTAAIFAREPRVFTCSVHGKHNYPFHKEQSDLDVPLPDHIEDQAYLEILENLLPTLLGTVEPDFIFYQAGVDILQSDKFGKLKITLNGCKTRDRIVLSAAKNSRIPCVVSMGGGYSPDIRHIVEAHCNTFRTAIDLYS